MAIIKLVKDATSNVITIESQVESLWEADDSTHIRPKGSKKVNAQYLELGSPAPTVASSVTVNPAGNIASTNVQSALEELDSEKQPTISNSTPASPSATGVAGTILWDSGYVYVCIATDTWKRVAISTW